MRAFSPRRRTLLAAAAGATALSSAGAWAQAGYPDRPINLVVGYSAGGAVDAVTTSQAEKDKKDAKKYREEHKHDH